MSWVSHIFASLTNPGDIPIDVIAPAKSTLKEICKKCEKLHWKPYRAHHCKECRHCTFKMDHHCPWINNCVGYWNYKSFNLFTFYICLGSLYSVIIHIYCFVLLLRDSETKHQANNPHYTLCLIFGVVCFFEGLLFTMFCFEMTRENFKMFWNNQTYIEDLQDKIGKTVSFM